MAEFPIVGIGSSAGGLEALQTLFRALPADSGLAFIIAAHLDPTQESHLTELLGRCTKMPVVQIEAAAEAAPDQVYVIAPDQELTIRKGVIHTNRPSAPRGHRHPIDSFFRSLAEDQGERAIAIILSGTGDNGSLGLRFIKAEGGIVLAQDPETAGFQGMPRSAVGTGLVDLVLPPQDMPEALLDLARHSYVRQPAAVVEATGPEGQLTALLTLVRAHTGRDFNAYKRRTLLRRIHRRMGLHQIEALVAYTERLRQDPAEIKALLADLTINVSGFFRDPEAWQTLAEKVVGPLVQERATGTTIRVWVPGCSTGEEAYSIAMLIIEQAEAAGKGFDLKLFATDVTEGVLTSARAGTYPSSVAVDVGDQRLQRFFEAEDDTYRIRKSLREALVFAPQNLLQDPPFSRLDLISCRNLMIYLGPGFQKRVLGLFHFALREGGHLFLGPAETTSSQEELFQAVSKRWRIFRRLGPTRHELADFPLIDEVGLGGHAETDAVAAHAERRVGAGELIDQALLERYAPASALIDSRYHVYYLRGPTDRYLRQPSGEPSSNLLAMAREGLQLPLRVAIRKVLDDGQESTATASVRGSDSLHPVRLVVSPLKTGRHGPPRLLVSFFEREVAADAPPPADIEQPEGGQGLQEELDLAREDLRISVEQMEAANEELKASNEEIRSINEELQASNKELETSKEEMQSLNEELNTVNHQLEAKVAELEARTDDLNNLLNSTDVATLFLDRSLCIRWFTPSMKALLELLPTDIGRPISHFAQRFSGGHLLEDARTVLERLVPISTEVMDDLGRWYIRRIMPYRTANDRIDGVVVTFTEITERKQHEQRVEDARQFAEQVIEAVRFPLVVLTPEQRIRSVNQAFCETFQVSRDETVGRLLAHLGNRAWDIPELHRLLARVLPEREEFSDFEIQHDFEGIGRRTMLLDGRPLDAEQLVLLGMVDITERQAAMVEQQESEERYRTLFDSIDQGFCTIEMLFDESGVPVDYRFLDVNDAFERQTGLADVVGNTMRSLVPDHEAHWFEIYGRVARTGKAERFEHEAAKLGHYYEVYAFRVGEPEDRKVGILFNDIKERKRGEEEREMLARELSHRVKNTLAVVQSLAMQTDGHDRSIDAWREAFVGRLKALARAHDLLFEAQWRGADLKALVGQAVAAYRVDHPEVIEVDGPSVAVTAKQALGLNLILHELGTNAVKYGALSSREGRLRISWQVVQRCERRVHLSWQERDGPKVEMPDHKGFGTRLIERACSYELEGTAELDYTPDGLSCELVFPLSLPEELAGLM